MAMQSPFTTALLRWFAQYGRELPWRGIGDPYGIWVSEIILQQTRIEQGRDYWLHFMERFPTVEALAAASEDEVLRQWQGLGYYSRARNLHAAARQIVEQGGFPQTLEGLRALKGVGDYTAAAVGSMAFGLPAAAVDGNVYRVLARHYGIDVPINSTHGKHTFQALAQELLPEDEPSAFNQAMMDFGATWCTPRSPRCVDCPLAQDAPLPDLACPLTMLARGVKHVLTHRILLADFYLAEPSSRPDLPIDYQWIDEHNLADYAVPRLVEKLMELLQA